MWLGAADSGELDTALITAVWTFLGIVVTTLGTIAVQALRRDRDTTSPSPPAPAPVNGNGTAGLLTLAKEQGVLHQRADDSDERDDMQDKTLHNFGDRIEALERHNDIREPGWRGNDRT